MRVDDVLALQRTMGNRATQRALAGVPTRSPVVRPIDHAANAAGTSAAIQRIRVPFRKNRQQKFAATKKLKQQKITTPQGQAELLDPWQLKQTPGPGAELAQGGLSTASAAVGVPQGVTGSLVGAKVKEGAPDDEYYSKDAKYKLEVIPGDARSAISPASSALGAQSSLLGMGGGIASMVMLTRKLKTADKKADKAEVAMDLIGTGVQTGTSVIQAGTSGTAVGTKVAGLAGESSAGSLSFILAGIGDIAGVVGSVFQMLVSGGKGVLGIIKVVMGRAKNKKEAILGIIANFLSAAKGLLATANSGIKAATSFMKALEALSAVVQTVPFVGGAINIASQAVDILVQTVTTLTQAIRMARARRYQAKMKAAKSEESRSRRARSPKTEQELLAEYLADINRKRFRRGWIPVLSALTNVIADGISIGSSLMNIAGTITSGAMGVGAGLLVTSYGMAAQSAVLKVGAAALKPVAFGVRKLKQKFRDVGASNRVVKAVGSKVGVNMNKTTAAKQDELRKSVDSLLTIIDNLMDDTAIDQLATVSEQEREKAKYVSAYRMIKATGISPKELLAAEDIPDMKQKLSSAMLARD
ncbi:MAG: hypothetical protein ACRDJH_27335 [Thermomicrobiales bacterium]